MPSIAELEVTQADRDASEHLAKVIAMIARDQAVPATIEPHFAAKLFARHRLSTISTLSARVEWQPIESVPKDGTLFDVWRDGVRFTDCHWERGLVMRKRGYPATWEVFNPQPTHWMPLPTPPSSEDLS